jgi:23S rRNA (uracil1939-C5)-methyltransferase
MSRRRRGPPPRRRDAPARTGAPFETVVDRLASDGAGIGRHPDGRIVFVPGTAPGDRVRVRPVEDRRTLVRGTVEALLEPSPERVPAPCPVFGTCGGCAWQHLAYPAQLRAKAAIVEDALVRLGGVDPGEPVVVTPSPKPYGYRGRARVRVEAGRPGFREAGSDAIVAVDDCPVLAPALRSALADLAARPRDDGEWELALGAPTTALTDGVRVTKLDAHADQGPPLALVAGGETVEIAPGGFAQANPLLFDALIEAVREACGTGDRLLELYAGAGFFTLPLARRFTQVTAVEASPAAVERLREAAAAAGLTGLEAWRDDVAGFVRGHRAAASAPEVVFMDPPRTGAGDEVVTALGRSSAHTLVYLSCDPATLARDLKALVAGGWALASVRAFDLFPQTPHVETLVVLRRR